MTSVQAMAPLLRTVGCRPIGIARNDKILRLLDEGRAFDTGLSWKYDGCDPDPDPPGTVRLILRLEVDKATGYAA
jgi:hypothetical protein